MRALSIGLKICCACMCVGAGLMVSPLAAANDLSDSPTLYEQNRARLQQERRAVQHSHRDEYRGRLHRYYYPPGRYPSPYQPSYPSPQPQPQRESVPWPEDTNTSSSRSSQ